MAKKFRVREPFDKQHGRSAQGLLKSASQHFYYIYWSLPSQLSWKKSLLLTCKILVLFDNTLAADEKDPLFNSDNLTIQIQMQLSQQQKIISQLSAKFLKSRLNFKYFEKKDDPHRFCISEITDSENVVIWIYKRCCLRQPFGKQHGKRAQALLIPSSKHLYLIHWSLPSQFSWKKSLLLTCKILVLLVNTLAADEKFPVSNRDNLTIRIQSQLSQKRNTFPNFWQNFGNLD